MQDLITRFFDSAFKTVKLSPKVALPGALLFTAGAVLLIVGPVNHDSAMRDYGLAAVAASGVVHTVGYVAPPGTVIPKDVSDLGLAESGDGEAEQIIAEGGDLPPAPAVPPEEPPPPPEAPVSPPPAAPAQ